MSVCFLRTVTIYVLISLLFPLHMSKKSKNLTRLVRGGEPVQLGEIPYQIAFKQLSVDSRYHTFCGGAIIGKSKILSAAHCFVIKRRKFCFGYKTQVMSLKDKYAVAGTIRNVAYFKEENDSQWRSIQTVSYPSGYDFPKNDIAVLFVVSPFEYNSVVKPIKVDDQYTDYEGLCLISGYGDISHSVCSQLSPGNINMYRSICTSVSVADIGQDPRQIHSPGHVELHCLGAFLVVATVDSGFQELQWFGNSMGDSGGPLVYSYDFNEDNRTLIGVASASYINHISLFVRVSSYRNFIANCCGKATRFYYVFIINLVRGKENSLAAFNKSYAKEMAYKKWAARIMNGWPAKLGDVPYQISLKALVNRANSIYQNFCGAVLVSPRRLISAAHCFADAKWSCSRMFNPGKITANSLHGQYAVAGNLFNTAIYQEDSVTGGQWRTLEKVQYPPKYKFPKWDIAVVVTDESFNFNYFIKPIPMASVNIDYSGVCLASGYGRTGHGAQDRSTILLLARIIIHPISVCNKLFGKPMHEFICTSIGFTDVGKGDSGGPLVCANTGDPNEISNKTGILVGIVSGHTGRTGSFFTRVSRYRKFIDSISSVSMIMYKYTLHSCIAIATSVLYKTFVVFRFVLF